MFIAGYDVKLILGSVLAVLFIFGSLFSLALFIRNLGHWVGARGSVERGLWASRWLRPAIAFVLCAGAAYLLLVYVLK